MKRDTHLSVAAGVVALLSAMLHVNWYDFSFALLAALAANVAIDMVGHGGRGYRTPWSHNIFFATLLPVLILYMFDALTGWRYITPLAYLVAAIGGLSHIPLDAITRAGVYPLWPLSTKRIRGPIYYDNYAVNRALELLGGIAFIIGVAALAWHAS